MKRIIGALCIVGWCSGALASAGEEIICREAKFAFTVPSDDWRVNTEFIPPVAASLANNKLNGIITLTYSDYDIYGFKVDYRFLKDKLEKNEKNTFKPTKLNYDRVSLGDKDFAFGRAARLEFTTFDELGYHHTVVYAISNRTIVYFCSVESLEREWPLVEKDFEALVTSIRFLP